MNYLTSEISLEQIDDWFKFGKAAASKPKPLPIKPVPAGQLLGRPLDPETGRAYTPKEPEPDEVHPSLRARLPNQEYEEQYDQYIQQSQDNVELLQPDVVAGTSGVDDDDVVNPMEQLELDSTLCGSVGVGQDLLPEGALAVYDNYSFQHRYDPKLPITHRAEEVLYTIESNQVTIIQGSTGSGKTTQVPQYILDHYAEKEEYCNIIVTQPRRIAAMSIAKRVCHERGWPLGSVCGYQIGMDMKSSEDTRILYCTTGVLREKLMHKKNMLQFTHVILDEVHERDQESDFALLVVKKLLRTNSPQVKVILMSATMQCEQFSRYFSLPVAGHMAPAPVVNVEGQVFKVLKFFADDLSSLGEVPRLDENDPRLHPEVVDMAVKLIGEFDGLEAKEQGVDQGTGFATVRGTVLIFLPGIVEISYVLDKLRTIESSSNLTLIPLHSTITLDEQARAFEKPARGFRKVILSTNIAESSITVPDIKYVIDFCLTKCLVCDRSTNYTHLQLEWASKSNCIQRKGRAGRVSQGRCYVMVTRQFYEYLDDHSMPEMQRCPLETLVLKTKLLDMGEPIALLSQALSPPQLRNIERTILILKQVGALALKSGGRVKRYDGDLTFVGRVLADLPVDIRVGKLMILGYVFGLLEECIIIGAALSLKSIFATPFQSRFQAFMHKYQWASGSLSDCQAILHAYRVWKNCKDMQEFKRSGLTETEWGKKNFIQVRRMNEVHELVRELSQRLEKFNLVHVKPRAEYNPYGTPLEEPGQMSPKDSLFLKVIMCGAFYPNYYCKKPGDEMEALRTLCQHDPLNTVMVRGLPQNQGLLYRDRLMDLFQCCCPRDVRPIVNLEESRAYITFPRSEKDSSPQSKRTVNPSVCFAIKLRLLRIPLRLEMYNKEATDSLKQLMESAYEDVAARGMLRTSRVSASDTAKKSVLKMALPDPTQSVLEVVVTEVVQCGQFFVQRLDHTQDTLRSSMHMMLNLPGGLPPLSSRPMKDMMCAAPFENAFYRARVDKLETTTILHRGIPTTRRVAQVFFVDFGNRDSVYVDALCTLPAEALNIPLLALECELTELQPSSVQCPDGQWTAEANHEFKKMVLGKKLLIQVYSVLNGVVRVELVQPTPQGTEISINECLIHMRLAEKVEETYLSKQDHEWRLAEATGATSLGSVQPSGTFSAMSMAESQHAVHVDIKCPPSEFRRKGRMINLTGPIHPLEMEFMGVSFSSQHRFVRVDPDSVNSTVVDAEPQNKFSRLMVAAFPTLNPDGDTIVARDTTVMPQVPGMLALMALTFSPVVELRVEPSRKHYSGVLCGLGYVREGEKSIPLLPEHDMELTFDSIIDEDDIQLINRVRHAINLALGSRTNIAEWGPDAVAGKIQMPARSRLLELLYKDREFKEPEYYPKEYYWNRLKPSEVISQRENYETDSLTLLPPLNTVRLARDNDMDNNKQHIDQLHRIALSHQRGPFTCQLCRVTVTTSQLLAIHLETERHLRREQNVIDHYCNKE